MNQVESQGEDQSKAKIRKVPLDHFVFFWFTLPETNVSGKKGFLFFFEYVS